MALIPMSDNQGRPVVPEYADLVFLLDSSSNMGDRNFSQMKSLISKIISALSVGVDKYRIGLAQYDDDIKVAFLLNTYKARNPVLNHIKTKIHFQGGSLKTGNALTKAHGLFFTGVNGRDKSKYPPVLVVITSGASLDEVNQPAIALQQDGVNIISVGLPNAPSSQLEAIATTPALALQISNIRDLNSFSKNLVTTLQDVVQNKYALPTGQGTTATTIAIKTPPEVATTTATTIDIKVPPEFTSTPPVFTNQTNGNKSKQYYCEQGLASDMVFLVDTSRHTYSENEYLKNFLTNVTSELAISEFCVHMRIVKFGRTATLISPLDNGKNKSAVIQSLDSLLSMEEEISNIGAAINFTRQVVIGDAKTSRKNQGIEQIAVLVSHRSSADDVSEAAYLLRQEKVRIFTVGIGTANKTQLTQISSYPTDHYLVNVESFENLPTQVDILLKKVENVIEEDILMYSEKTDIIKRGCLNIEVADLYLLIDGSESIGIQGFKEMKTFLMEMVEMFDIGPQKVRVGAVQYSHERKEEFSITREFDKTSLKLALQSLRQLGGGTNTGNALNFTHNIIIDPNNARPVKVPVFLVVLTDGESQDSVKEAAEMLRVDDVKVYAIGVKHANLTQLQEITGDSKKVHFVQDFDGLKDIKNLIAEQICSTEACQDVRADIMFLVESSSNIQIDNFKKMKSFMKNLVEKIEVGPDKVQFGVVQFSDISKEAFQLNKHMTKQAIWSSIDNMNYIGNTTYTGKALSYVSDYFTETKGARKNVKKFLILITDGKACDEVKSPAESLRNNSVIIYSIGVFNANKTQLEEISGKSKRFYLESFDDLKTIENQLTLGICSAYEDCKRIEVADIVFVIDSSGSIHPSQYDIMKDFMISLVNKSNIGPKNVQFGALKYSNDPSELFHLNKYSNKLDIINEIKNDYVKGGDTYTAKALDHSTLFFAEKQGSRIHSGVPQILIILTDGESHDRDKLNETSRKLQDAGIIVYAIGIDKANTEELITMAGSNGRWFLVQNFTGLKDIFVTVSEGMCNNTECKVEKADLVFLIDGSTSISTDDFKIMKNFMVSVINDFDVGPDKVHVGVAQYSHLYNVQFQLKTFMDKITLKSGIENITQIYGNTYIGDALSKTETELFSQSAKSRINEGVHQMLIVITDGNSHDKVAKPAQSLRSKGIDIYALGVGAVDTTQLLQIAGTRDKMITVDNFDKLTTTKGRLVKDICSENIQNNCSVEVVVTFDISTQSIDQTLFHGQSQLENLLFDIFQSMTSLRSPSCGKGIKPQVNVAFHVKNAKESVSSNFHVYSPDLIRNLQKVQVVGPSYLKSSVLLSMWDAFPNKNTGKAKMLLVFTDGLDEDVEKLESTAEDLLKQGLDALVTVGLEGAKNHQDFKFIEFGRGFEFDNQMHIGMSDIDVRLARQLSHVVEKKCCCVLCKCSGLRGSSGKYGRPGMKGIPGAKGQQGHIGEEGEAGERGLPGLTGIPGDKGCPGSKGLKGTIGIAGSKNDDGEPGINGIPGEQGHYGPPGKKGEKGVPGEAGEPGHQGIPGVPGSRGNGGIKGDQGETGYTGKDGLRGPQGNSGIKGIKGEKGSSGPNGIPGPFGIQGGIGNQGVPGHKGKKGEPGDTGEKGDLGPAGERGVLPEIQYQPSKGIFTSREDFGLSKQTPILPLPTRNFCQTLHGNCGKIGSHNRSSFFCSVSPDASLVGPNLQLVQTSKASSSNDKDITFHKAISPLVAYKFKSADKQTFYHHRPGDSHNRPKSVRLGSSVQTSLHARPVDSTGVPHSHKHLGATYNVKCTAGMDAHSEESSNSNSDSSGILKPSRRDKKQYCMDGSTENSSLGREPCSSFISYLHSRTGELGGRLPQPSDHRPRRIGTKPVKIPSDISPMGNSGHRHDGIKKNQKTTNFLGKSNESRCPKNPMELQTCGEDGLPGYGAPGKKGEKGQLGFQGHSGFKGIGGDSGIVGERGEKGYPGRSGYSQMGEVGDPGAPGPRGWRPCEVIEYVRNKCPCCQGKPTCPAYPTELVFALDMSNKVTSEIYKRMINIITDILSNVTVRESNCPVGARVAVVSFNKNTKYVLRFSDFHNKDKLIKAVQSIPLAKSSRDSDIGSAMKFVARNIFKRSPHGATVRRIAVFFSNGISEDAVSINTAVMEYSALGIIPSVIAFNPVPAIKTAFRMDTTGKFKLFEISPNVDYKSVIEAFQLCTLCFDQCKPDTLCVDRNTALEKSYMDVAFLLDSSYNVRDEEFDAAKRLISTVIDNFDIASQPKSDIGDRVALVSNTRDFTQVSQASPHIEFDLSTYKRNNQLKKHIKEKVSLQKGPPATGFTLQWTIDNIMSKSPNLRKHKVIIIILSGETSQWDKQTLSEAALNVKCQGYAIFVLSVGKAYNDTELMELASIPLEHHLLQLGRIHKPDLGYAVGFLQLFLNSVRRELYQQLPTIRTREQVFKHSTGGRQQTQKRDGKICGTSIQQAKDASNHMQYFISWFRSELQLTFDQVRGSRAHQYEPTPFWHREYDSSISDVEGRLPGDNYSLKDEGELPEDTYLFPSGEIEKLVLEVWTIMDIEDTKEPSRRKDQLFKNFSHQSKVFPVHEVLASMISDEWKVPDQNLAIPSLFQHETQRLEKPEFEFFDHSKMHWISKDQSVDHSNMEAFTSNTLERGLIREEYGKDTTEHITYNSSVRDGVGIQGAKLSRAFKEQHMLSLPVSPDKEDKAVNTNTPHTFSMDTISTLSTNDIKRAVTKIKMEFQADVDEIETFDNFLVIALPSTPDEQKKPSGPALEKNLRLKWHLQAEPNKLSGPALEKNLRLK
ncbi:collagen alpha-6(VI) chain-like [Rhinophrynus dorsalis]